MSITGSDDGGGGGAMWRVEHSETARARHRSDSELEATVGRIFNPLPARYDVLEDVLSLGQNRRWRDVLVGHVLSGRSNQNDTTTGSRLILDLATGTAGVALSLVDRSSATVVGADLTLAMLTEGRRRVQVAGQQHRIALTNSDARTLPFRDASFDGLCVTYLFRYVADQPATLSELARVLKPGAPLASLEFGLPNGDLTYPLWWAYTRLVLPAAGLVAGGAGWFQVGRFLGPSIEEYYASHPLAQTAEDLKEAGFVDVSYTTMSLGGGVVFSARRGDG